MVYGIFYQAVQSRQEDRAAEQHLLLPPLHRHAPAQQWDRPEGQIPPERSVLQPFRQFPLRFALRVGMAAGDGGHGGRDRPCGE